MKRVVLLGLVLAGLLAGTAQASTTIIEPVGSHPSYQSWVDEALVQTYDGEVIVGYEIGRCEGGQACADVREGAIPEIELGPGAERFTLFHELGHVYDLENSLTQADREAFMAINGLTAGWWESGEAPGWVVPSPAENFAEAYAACAGVRHPSFSYVGNDPFPIFDGIEGFGMIWEPHRGQFLRTCALLGRHLTRVTRYRGVGFWR